MALKLIQKLNHLVADSEAHCFIWRSNIRRHFTQSWIQITGIYKEITLLKDSTFFFFLLYLEEVWVSLLKQSGSVQFPEAASAILAQSLLSEVCYVGWKRNRITLLRQLHKGKENTFNHRFDSHFLKTLKIVLTLLFINLFF